jgi:predicted MFS family arabinose efflux permease
MLVAAIQGSMMLGALLGGVLVDTRGPSAPLTAAVIILAAAAVYVGIIMRASRPAIDQS